jgi:DNA-binding response OmpR family regulator
MVGSDPSLAYLIERYSEQSGLQITIAQDIPSAEAVYSLKPSMLLFPNLESLEAAQGLIAELANSDISVLVCSSVADQARANELGADHCLLHPLSYDGFLAALTALRTPRAAQS